MKGSFPGWSTIGLTTPVSISISELSTSSQKINLFNNQDLDLDASALEGFLQQLAERLAVQDGFTVVLVNDEMMKEYNRRFAGQETPTDVLSFPGEQDWPMEAPYAGDVLISVESALRQTREGLLSELKVLSLHGLLHLLGYDHQSDDGEMLRLEATLKKEFRLT